MVPHGVAASVFHRRYLVDADAHVAPSQLLSLTICDPVNSGIAS